MAGVILDANFLIALYNESDVHHGWAREVMLDTLSDELFIPALSYAETLVRPAITKQSELLIDALSELGIEVVPLVESSAVHLAHVRADSKLRMPDAVVLQVALEKGSAIATSDQTLAKAAHKAGVTVFKPIDRRYAT